MKLLSTLVLFMILSSYHLVFSQAMVKKNILIEEFTSATCKPCKLAGPILAKIVQPTKDVYSVRYHIKFPPADDPIYLQNIPGITNRAGYYGVSSGIPNIRVNGTGSANPANESQANSRVDTARGQMTPVSLSVVKSIDGDSVAVTVKVRTSVVLPTNARLFIAINNRRVYLPKLPFTLPGSNEKEEFEDAFMEMLPDGGIPLALSPNVEQTFVRKYKPKVNEYWPNDMSYPVVFVQDTSSRQVFQCATDYQETQTELKLLDTKYPSLNSNSSVTRRFSVKNPNTEALEVKLVLDTAGSPMPKGWSFSCEPESQMINAGDSGTYTVILQSTNDTAYFQHIKVFAYGVTSKIDIPSNEYFHCLSSNAKYVLYTFGERSLDTVLMNDLKSAHYHKETVSMRYADSLLTNYPITNFDVSIFSLHGGTILKQENRNGIPLASVSNNTPNFISKIIEAYNSNKKVFIIAPRATWWALKDTTTAADGKVTLARNFLTNTMGVQLNSSLNRTQNNLPIAYPVKGVLTSPYFSDISAQINTSPSFSSTFTDILGITSGSKSEPFMYSDDKTDNVIGVGMTDNEAKIYMSTFSIDAWVQNKNQRKLFVNRVVDWLLSKAPSPNTVLSVTTPNELNLGNKEVAKSHAFEISITATPMANFVVSSISKKNNAFSIDNEFLSSLPKTVSTPTFLLKGTFTPTETKQYRDTITLYSTALNSEFSFIISGTGTPPVSVQEVPKEVNESTIRLNGTKGVTIDSKIELSSAEVYDLQGQVVYSASLSGLQYDLALPPELGNGTYFLKITYVNGSKQVHSVVIVQ